MFSELQQCWTCNWNHVKQGWVEGGVIMLTSTCTRKWRYLVRFPSHGGKGRGGGVIRSNSLTFASRIIKNHELNHQVPSNLCTANTEFARTRPMPHWIIRFFSTCTRNECSVEFISFLSVCTRNKCQVKSKDLQDTGSQTQAYMVQACSPTPLPVMVMVPVLVMDCSPCVCM